MFKKTFLVISIAAASTASYGETVNNAKALDALLVEDTIGYDHTAIAASRASETDGAISITAKDISDLQASNLADAIQSNATVQVDEVGGSRGSVITIRGQSGDSVSVRVEGAPNSRNQIMHKNANDRDTIWLNMDMYEAVTAIAGAGASEYGNGSTGGVILLETKDPDNIIQDGRDWGANLRYSLETNGASNGVSADVAKSFSDKFSANATISIKDTEAYEDANGYEADNGSTGSEDLSYLVKGVLTPTDEHRIEAAVMQNDKDYSDFADDGAETKKEVREQNISANYSYKPKNNDLVDLKVRVTRTESDQQSDGGIGVWGATGGVITTFGEIENSSVFYQSDSISHLVRYGFDFADDEITLAYGREDGNGQKMVDRTAFGAYVSDSMDIGENLLFSGSVRVNKFNTTYNGVDVAGGETVNPKVSTLWTPFENTSFHGFGVSAMVGSGYRLPAVYEIYGKTFAPEVFEGTDSNGDGIYEVGNVAGCMDGHGNWCVIPNEDLVGESSINTEFGFTFARNGVFKDTDKFYSKLAYIHNDIKDKIYNETFGELDESLGTYNDTSYSVRKFINKDEAAIYGWELEGRYTNDEMFAKLTFNEMEGHIVEDDGSETPDTSIAPRNISVSIGKFFSNKKGKVGVNGTYRKGRSFMGGRNGDVLNEYDSYMVVDVFTTYNVTDNLSVLARIDNISDELYSKSVKATNAETGADATSYLPGRNFKMGVNYRF